MQMTNDRKHELRSIIAKGERLTIEQDDEAYALLPPDEYYDIPDDLKPVTSELGVDPVKEALNEAARIFKTVDPVAWISGIDYVDWCTVQHKVNAALAAYDASPPSQPATSARKGSTVRCINDGTEYPSIAACARAYGVSATMISNHINGNPSYPHVRGKKFERI